MKDPDLFGLEKCSTLTRLSIRSQAISEETALHQLLLLTRLTHLSFRLSGAMNLSTWAKLLALPMLNKLTIRSLEMLPEEIRDHPLVTMKIVCRDDWTCKWKTNSTICRIFRRAAGEVFISLLIFDRHLELELENYQFSTNEKLWLCITIHFASYFQLVPETAAGHFRWYKWRSVSCLSSFEWTRVKKFKHHIAKKHTLHTQAHKDFEWIQSSESQSPTISAIFRRSATFQNSTIGNLGTNDTTC